MTNQTKKDETKKDEVVFSYVGIRLGGKSLVVSWSAPSLGFGSIFFKFLDKEGFVIETEYMDEKFVISLVNEVKRRVENKEPVLMKLVGYDKEIMEPEYETVVELEGIPNSFVIAVMETFLKKAKLRG